MLEFYTDILTDTFITIGPTDIDDFILCYLLFQAC